MNQHDEQQDDVNEIDRLLVALDTAGDEDARQAILDGCAAERLEQLVAALHYRRCTTETLATFTAEQLASEDCTAALDNAASDEERAGIVELARRDPERGTAWLSEFAWRRRATPFDAVRRYLALMRQGESP